MDPPILMVVFVPLTRLVGDEWMARLAAHPSTTQWLRDLDRNPAPLVDWIFTHHLRRYKRLGFYFAYVWGELRVA